MRPDTAPQGGDATRSHSPPPALKVRDLTVSYGHTTVLRDLSLVVEESSVVTLVGPNGSGKTTLLRTIAGLLQPRAGAIEIAGIDVRRQPPERRAAQGLCLIPEGRGIYRSLSVRENLVMQSPKGSLQATFDRAAEAFPILGQRMHQQAGTLSGGEQQVLALAAAYVRDVRLILVDEASLGLAPKVIDVVFDFLQRVSGEGVSLLLVDQYVHRVLELADRAYVLRRGSIVFDGRAAGLSTGEIFDRYVAG